VPCLAVSAKKKHINIDENFFHRSSLTFFEVSSSLLLEYGRLKLAINNYLPTKQMFSVRNCLLEEIESLFNETDGEGILLLFDGTEYMPDADLDVMSEISEIICGKRWPKCSVILTTNFLEDFNENYEPQIYKNVFFFHNQSTQSWKRFNLIGFTTHDVITHTQRYFEHNHSKNDVILTRQFLNFCRVFQRDVYSEISSSPMFTFLLASLWSKVKSKYITVSSFGLTAVF